MPLQDCGGSEQAEILAKISPKGETFFHPLHEVIIILHIYGIDQVLRVLYFYLGSQFIRVTEIWQLVRWFHVQVVRISS